MQQHQKCAILTIHHLQQRSQSRAFAIVKGNPGNVATLDDADGIQVKVPEFNMVEKKVPRVFDRERFSEFRKVGATSDADVIDDLTILRPPDKGVVRNVPSKLVDSWERSKAHVGVDYHKGDGQVKMYVNM